MPSGKTHDAITLLLAVPVYALAVQLTTDTVEAWVVAGAFVFGGVMFGPDLDTASRQYSRWGPMRALWLPYRHFFPHRSRFSHGLAFGALFRVIYFMGCVTLMALAGLYLYRAYAGGSLPGLADIPAAWGPIGTFSRGYFGINFFLLVFAGLWMGAASHTFTDLAGSFIKTGRAGKFF